MKPLLATMLLLGTLLAMTSSAGAREHFVVVDGFMPPSSSKGGYVPDVYAHRNSRIGRSVSVGVLHSWRGYTYYGKRVSRNRFDNHGFRGKVGKFGRAKIRVRPAGYKEEIRFGGGPCNGKKIVVEMLEAWGRVKIRGERGIAAFDLKTTARKPWYATRISYPSGSRCSIESLFGETRIGVEDGVVELSAASTVTVSGKPAVAGFTARRATELYGSLAVFETAAVRRNGRVFVQSGNTVVNPSGRFSFGPELEWAKVNPLAGAITGTASFDRIDATNYTWTGNLAMTLPGWPRVRLAGPGVTAGLVPFTGQWEMFGDFGFGGGFAARGTVRRAAIDKVIKRVGRKR